MAFRLTSRHWLFGAALLGIVFLTRIFYASYVWADEGLWFTAADELLRGRSLYSQIWFDKPPAVAWVYAALFKLTGPSILAVRLFTILYATAVCAALWHIGARFWSEREGRFAALFYAVYNATYIHSQVQPMAVDQLVLLPYLYAGYFFLSRRWFRSGLLAATAFSLNPKAIVLAPLFAVAAWAPVPFRVSVRVRGWLLFLAGAVLGTAPWLAYALTGGRWHWYVRDFWGWGFRYVTVYSPGAAILNGLHRTRNWAGFHFALILGAVLLLVVARRARPQEPPGRRAASHALWWWLAFSYLGVAAGGRFFPRYFYQVLPFLCLLAARGYVLAFQPGHATGSPSTRAAHVPPSPAPLLPPAWRTALRVLFWAGIVFSLVRFHHRGLLLAYEKVTGRQTAYMRNWKDPEIDRGSRLIAQRVRGALFVWGYRPEIYFYCQCPAASMYLSDQPLTGVPADIHLREATNVAPARAAENRAHLLDELRNNRPDFIVDGIGPYNPALAITQYPEVWSFVEQNYREADEIGGGVIYRRVR